MSRPQRFPHLGGVRPCKVRQFMASIRRGMMTRSAVRWSRSFVLPFPPARRHARDPAKEWSHAEEAEEAEVSRAVAADSAVRPGRGERRHGAPADEARAGAELRKRGDDWMRQRAIRVFGGRDADGRTVFGARGSRPSATPAARSVELSARTAAGRNARAMKRERRALPAQDAPQLAPRPRPWPVQCPPAHLQEHCADLGLNPDVVGLRRHSFQSARKPLNCMDTRRLEEERRQL
jgi:hypothetical protein